MDYNSIIEFLKKFETTKVVNYLATLNLHELVNNPYFLSGIGALAVIALLMRWRVLLVTILGVSGFVWLLSYTLQKDTSLEGGLASDTLFVFVGGGTVIIFMVIYFLFIRND